MTCYHFRDLWLAFVLRSEPDEFCELLTHWKLSAMIKCRKSPYAMEMLGLIASPKLCKMCSRRAGQLAAALAIDSF